MYRCIANRLSGRRPMLLAAVVLALGAAPGAWALTLDDWPVEWRPEWFDTIDPNGIAFAVYDYKLTTGFEGQHTDLLKGPLSLFDETESGISGLEGDWTWVAGTGWTAPLGRGPAKIYHWRNVRVETNKKQFVQLIDIAGQGIPDCGKIEVFTENGTDQVSFNVAYHPGGTRLGIKATIIPQPRHVFVRIPFKAAGRGDVVVEKGWVLDQCVLIPEPASLALVASGALLAFRRRKDAMGA